MDHRQSPFFTTGFRESRDDDRVEFIAPSCGLEDFPRCPSCTNVLQRTLTIPSQIMMELTGSAPFGDQDLLFCWQCYACSGLAYRGSLSSDVQFIDWFKKPIENNYPLWPDYPVGFPARTISFSRQPETEKQILFNAYQSNDFIGINQPSPETTNDHFLFDIHYAIGGVPALVHQLETTTCPACHKDMNLLATIPNANGRSTGFCDTEYIAMVYMICPACNCIHATHQVD